MASNKLRVQSIEFVHDPQAAQHWFNIFIDMVTEEVKRQASKEAGSSHIIQMGDDG